MKKLFFALAVLPAAAFAQTAEDAAAALVLPMIQEIQPGQAGIVLTDCIIAGASADEVAAFAAAPAPSAEIGAIINDILARPATMQCLQEAAG